MVVASVVCKGCGREHDADAHEYGEFQQRAYCRGRCLQQARDAAYARHAGKVIASLLEALPARLAALREQYRSSQDAANEFGSPEWAAVLLRNAERSERLAREA